MLSICKKCPSYAEIIDMQATHMYCHLLVWEAPEKNNTYKMTIGYKIGSKEYVYKDHIPEECHMKDEHEA